MSAPELIRPMDLAARLGVHVVTVNRWCREGRLRATKIGRGFFISRIEAELFESAYLQTYGDSLSPEVPARPTRYRVPNRSTRPGTGSQSFYVTMPTQFLRMMDEERRMDDDPVSRSEFVGAAVGHYIAVRKHERRGRKAS